MNEGERGGGRKTGGKAENVERVFLSFFSEVGGRKKGKKSKSYQVDDPERGEGRVPDPVDLLALLDDLLRFLVFG